MLLILNGLYSKILIQNELGSQVREQAERTRKLPDYRFADPIPRVTKRENQSAMMARSFSRVFSEG